MSRAVAAPPARADAAFEMFAARRAACALRAASAPRAATPCAVRLTHYAPKPRDALTHYKHENIRTSPWKLNLLAKLVRNLWVPDALAQLQFTKKRYAPTVADAIERCAARAGAAHELVPEELEVERAFVTPAPFLKRIKFMGRGRSGTVRKRAGHLNVSLCKVDFPAKIAEAKNHRQKRKWMQREADARAARERVLGAFAFPDEAAVDAEVVPPPASG